MNQDITVTVLTAGVTTTTALCLWVAYTIGKDDDER